MHNLCLGDKHSSLYRYELITTIKGFIVHARDLEFVAVILSLESMREFQIKDLGFLLYIRRVDLMSCTDGYYLLLDNYKVLRYLIVI